MAHEPLSSQLKAGVSAGIISQQQAEALQALWQPEPGRGPARFDLTHLLYYLGALLAIGAMTVFMELGWERFGGFGVMGLALFYGLLGLVLQLALERRQLWLPAGLALVFVVCLTPLVLYGFQQGMGWWPEQQPYPGLYRRVEAHWVSLELATLLAAMLALTWRRVPFLICPLAISLWFLSMDGAQWLLGERLTWPERGQISMVMGLVMVGLGLYVDGHRDRENHRDFAFWLYLFGVVAFWGGLSSQQSDSEWDRALYGFINLLMMLVGVMLNRRVFTVFGALGLFAYLGHLAYDLFRDSWWFPALLTLLGLGIILLGVAWQRHHLRWRAALLARLPDSVRQFGPFN
ncbi:DUF2157 domain-containing protein [Ferrimonas balearica]|uniref:DUF2157 domain-containing protein n=1 Tax=Ferrimonas balearica TaxID=44012 RepID=UPI001C992361|nr:DUF2157 domain-containing protein [Ferrimonas balearica]MBY5920780.1 DUF2157 domain-containing protein [Ferrimonas balearica]MBY5996535.1 DUF2157 domain-containing protein [Ferrimonas balearica]